MINFLYIKLSNQTQFINIMTLTINYSFDLLWLQKDLNIKTTFKADIWKFN
jgi:hypothetical protein